MMLTLVKLMDLRCQLYLTKEENNTTGKTIERTVIFCLSKRRIWNVERQFLQTLNRRMCVSKY